MKFCFVFVCQQGELEVKSMLLAASLRENLRGDYELVAAIPKPESRWNKISELTNGIIKQLDIRIENIENKIDVNYPIGNKVSCFNIKTDADKVVFVDSDVLCMKPFLPEKHFTEQFCAKPVDRHWFNEWKQVYELFDIKYPTERFKTTINGETILPYFNAGLIVVDNNINFSDEWIDCCNTIDNAEHITDKRPWLDQIALPIVLKRKNLKYKILDNKYNYPLHELKSISSDLPFFCHYHYSHIITKEKKLLKFVKSLITKYPNIKKYGKILPDWEEVLCSTSVTKAKYLIKKNHSIIKQVAKENYLKQYSKKNKFEQNDVIITGIPRSGTSYLCKLLHSQENTVVINEPEEVIYSVSNYKKLWRIKAMYNIFREKINSNNPIYNKTDDNKIIDDTAENDIRTLSIQKVETKDFCLITKNTLAYLFVLPELINQYPKMPIIACLRNPLDTIASWKRSFPHLRYVRFEEFPIDIRTKKYFTKQQQKDITIIDTEIDFEIKRALLWNFLAQIIYENKEKIIVLKYEDFITNTNHEISKIQEKYPQLEFKSDFSNSDIRSNIEVLHKDEIEKITSVCKRTALKFDYKL